MGQPINITDENGKKEIVLDSRQYYSFLKMSFILGDHDINPGNFFVIYNKKSKESHIGRIDWGHAFSDLIKKWFIGGNRPDLKEGVGVVMDALNRKRINGGQSRFIRDISPNVLYDDSFIETFRRNEKHDAALIHATNLCKDNLSALMKKDKRSCAKIAKGLITLNNKMNCPSIPKNTLLEEVLKIVLGNCCNYVSRNYSEAVSVRNILKLQKSIKVFVDDNKEVGDLDKRRENLKRTMNEVIAVILTDSFYMRDILSNLMTYTLRRFNGFLPKKNSKAKKSSVVEYISDVLKTNKMQDLIPEMKKLITNHLRDTVITIRENKRKKNNIFLGQILKPKTVSKGSNKTDVEMAEIKPASHVLSHYTKGSIRNSIKVF